MRTEKVKVYLAEMGLPRRDVYQLPTSDKKFPDTPASSCPGSRHEMRYVPGFAVWKVNI